MPRKTAGARYPFATTATREHAHQFCPVIAAIARRAKSGGDSWGTLHTMPAVADEADAKAAKNGFYAARYCAEVREVIGEPASIQAGYEPDGDAFRPWVRVWPRSVAKQEIARRVAAGEQLSYNVARRRA